MTTTINADNGVVSTIPGLKYSADSSGVLVLQTNTTNALTLDASQNATFATGILATNPFAGSFSDGTVVDYTTGVGRITVGTSDDIAFYHNGIASRTEIARFTYGGSLGVGTVTPNKGAAATAITVNNSNAGNYSSLEISTADSERYRVSANNGAVYQIITNAVPFMTYVNGSERMRVDSSGNVGIGTTNTASFRLNVADGSSATRMWIYNTANAAAGAGIYMQVYNGATLVTDNTIAVDNAGAMKFFTGTTSGSERMRIDSSGSVGIGTASPSSLLHISSANTAFTATSTTATSSTQLRVVTGAGTCYFAVDGSGGPSFGVANAAVVWNAINSPLLFATNNAERMRILADGKVGIGTAVPNSGLAIATGSLPNPPTGAVGISGGLTTGRFGTYDAGTLGIIGNAADASSFEFIAGSTAGYYAGISITGSNATLYQGTVRFATAGTERMRINSSGQLLIGTTNIGTTDCQLAVSNNTNNGMEFSTTAISTENRLLSYNRTSSVYAAMNYVASQHKFLIASTQQAAIDSSGNFSFNSGYGSAATAYGCRAWVRFNGANGAITGSGGVSSVTRSSTGSYIVYFSFTFPDTNYATFVTDKMPSATNYGNFAWNSANTTYVVVYSNYNGTVYDAYSLCVSVFR